MYRFIHINKIIMKRIFLLTFLIPVVVLTSSCSSSNDEEPQETLYNVEYSDIVFSRGHELVFYEVMHPTDSMTIYSFNDYQAGKDAFYLTGSFKEVYYSKTQKSNYYNFTYTFSNSTANIKYDNGRTENIQMKKNTAGKPVYGDIIYFNGKAYSPGASL